MQRASSPDPGWVHPLLFPSQSVDSNPIKICRIDNTKWKSGCPQSFKTYWQKRKTRIAAVDPTATAPISTFWSLVESSLITFALCKSACSDTAHRMKNNCKKTIKNFSTTVLRLLIKAWKKERIHPTKKKAKKAKRRKGLPSPLDREKFASRIKSMLATKMRMQVKLITKRVRTTHNYSLGKICSIQEEGNAMGHRTTFSNSRSE